MAVIARRRRLEKLKRHIEKLEQTAPSPAAGAAPVCALGPVTFGLGACHEIRAADYRDAPAAQGFSLALAGRIVRETGKPALWVGAAFEAFHAGHAYGGGLAGFGLHADDVIFVYPHTVKETLWAAEEAARSPRIGVVLIELMKPHKLLDLTATRRLQLAAEASGATPILMRCGEACASAARTRWRVAPAMSAADEYDAKASGNPRWRVEVERRRAGGRGRWVLEWNYERRELFEAAAHRGRHFAAMADGPPETAQAVA